MSANLDKSLDDLVGNRRQGGRRRSNRRSAAKPSVGGVKKSAKATKPAAKAVHPAPAAQTKSSKIIVSGLPSDVNESQIKEYFSKLAGSVKKVVVTYDQHGKSRGIAQVIFNKADSAPKAAKVNGSLVDGHPMKIEVVYDASLAPEVPAPKPLSERVAQKAQPKPATAAKPAGGARGRGRAAKAPRKGRNAGRGKPKTAEELDAEMVDYFSNENVPAQGNGAVNGTAQTNGGEDTGMAEIS